MERSFACLSNASQAFVLRAQQLSGSKPIKSKVRTIESQLRRIFSEQHFRVDDAERRAKLEPVTTQTDTRIDSAHAYHGEVIYDRMLVRSNIVHPDVARVKFRIFHRRNPFRHRLRVARD